MYFDTHAHLHDEAFDEDRSELIASFSEVGVCGAINASCSVESSKITVGYCEKYDNIFGSVGIHPDSADTFDSTSILTLSELLKKPKICAVGEAGLDYYYEGYDAELQKKVFEAQAALAYEMKVPLIVHDRDAHRDTFDILKKFPGISAVFHCFSGSVEFAAELMKLGFYLSFGGAITFKNARRAPEVLRSVPRDRVMLETDCPYMAPVPFRGKRNHPGFIPQITAGVSELWGIPTEEVGRITTENAENFFGIKVR